MNYLRCAFVWAFATSVAALAGRFLVTQATGSATAGFESLLLRSCSLALTACVGWLWLATTAVVLDAARRRPRRRRAVPAGLRRLVLAACGVALTAGAAPALATPGPVPLADLIGHPVAHLGGHHAVGRAVVVVPERARAGVVVRAGDSLWSIAARHLGTDATDHQVSETWHRIYQRNRSVIGPDPDLLIPGQHLELPR